MRIARPALPLLIGTVCLTLALAGCAGEEAGPSHARRSPSTSTTPKPAPALTAAQARDVINHYSEINNQANAERNRRLLDTVEDGPLYAQSVSYYTEAEGRPEADRKPERPWSYDTATAKLYIPRLAAGDDRWFIAALSVKGKAAPSWRLTVFVERPEHRRWEQVSVVDLDDQKLPEVALDRDGYATAVPATKQTVGELRSGVVDNFATGGTTKAFSPSKASKRQIAVHDETGTRYGDRGTTTFAGSTNPYKDTYAVRTSNGVLLMFSHTHTQSDAVAGPGLQIIPGEDDRAWLRDTGYTSIKYTFVCNDAATIPSRERPRLIGYTCARTNASGLSIGSRPTARG
ncbi:hypothetical protein C0Q63_22340 [Streptomyces albidoflavus]|nr:hypothetical protein C0Q63_22340 [Streptomyces albidoflavus]